MAFVFSLLLGIVSSCSASGDGFKNYVNTSRILFASASFDLYPLALEARQQPVCPVPGGVFCDANTCCEPGTYCIPGVGLCCCCPLGGQNCNNQGCCLAGTTCCGLGCCESGSICERGQCILEALRDKIVRFEYNKAKNGELLKNMCNGMRGKNTEILTYRGPDLSERASTRQLAGCTEGYCRNLIAQGVVPANFNSCDEYPPASSLEGGAARSVLERAVNCIPERQNSHQGGKLGGMVRRGSSRGTSIQRGDQFVISIDCDKVLQDLVPKKREIVTDTGSEVVETDPFFEDQESSYLLAPLGDLGPGTYSVTVNVTAGSTTGGFILDNQGDINITTNDQSAQVGQTQKYDFSLEYPMFGVGVLIGTMDTNTAITWNLEGETKNITTTSNGSPTVAPTAASSGVLTSVYAPWALVVMCFASLHILCRTMA